MQNNVFARSLCALALVLLLLALAPVSLAHPGRTDASGGHHVRDTGEYHYHHGRSAHQHSDLDGDGKLDCPYEFKSKTSSSSSASSKSSASSDSSDSPSTSERAYELKKQQKKNTSLFDRLGSTGTFCAGIALASILFNLGKFINFIKSIFQNRSS